MPGKDLRRPSATGDTPKKVRWWATPIGEGAIGVVVFLLIWQGVSQARLLNPVFISSPADVIKNGYQLIGTGLFWNDVRVSATEYSVGYVIAALVGIPLGILLGMSRRVDNYTQPLMSALYSTPSVAFFPIMLVWFGIGIRSKQALVFVLAVLPIIIAVRSGARVLSSQFTDLAKVYRATWWRMLRKIVLPGCMPSVLSGLRLAAGTGLVAVFVGELYAANSGVGYLAANAGETLDTSEAMFALFLFAVTGLALAGVITFIERRFVSWS